MTISEYAKKNGITENSVYHAVYRGRIPFVYVGNRLDIPDTPFPDNERLRKPSELSELPDYILALIWFCGSVSGDAILIRHHDCRIHEIISAYIKCNTWERDKTIVSKIGGVAIIGQLKSYGYFGKINSNRTPPPVEPLSLAKAYLESHTSFTRYLRHDLHNPGKENGSYIPSISFCSSAAILEAITFAFYYLNIAPIRKLSAAANGTSRVLKFTSPHQLRDMHRILSPDFGYGTNSEFWERFDSHISTPPIRYSESLNQK